MVRTFEDPSIIHVHEKIDPLFDIEIINLELEVADIKKPTLYVLNISEVSPSTCFDEAQHKPLRIIDLPGPSIKVDPVFGTGLDQLIIEAYKLLDLITFFTTGEKPASTRGGDSTRGGESRAWTIPRGSTAPRAGQAIHTDFEEKFIRAEVIAYDKLLEAGSYAKAREKGWLRIEGKEYIVQDGDVIEFLI